MINPMIFLLLAISLLFGGCATIKNYPDRTVNPRDDLNALNGQISVATYISYQNNPRMQRLCRNDLINARILDIDLNFEKFQEDLVRESAFKDLSAEWSTLALSGASAVVPLAETKTVLSAISAGITGAQGSIDKNLFFKKTIVALITQMKADRASKHTDILQKMDLDTDKYPLTMALIDLEDYYKAGTLPQALTSISATAGAKIKDEKNTQKELMTLSGKYSKDTAGDTLMSCIDKYGKPFADKLQQWITDHNVNFQGVQPHIFSFIRDEKFSQQRQQAILDLPKLLPGGDSK